MATSIRDTSDRRIMRTANGFRRMMIVVIAIALTSYAVLFYAMRFGVRASNYPRIYIFSSDPERNQLAHRFFNPMIVITGGVSLLPPESSSSEGQSTDYDDRPVYFIGNEPLFGRIAAHYDAFLDLPQMEQKEEAGTLD